MKILKYYEIWKINILNTLMYFIDYASYSVLTAVVIFIFVNMWKTIYSTNLAVEGFTLVIMIWYLVLTESMVMNMGGTELIKELNQEVKSGDLSYTLNKPYNYILYHYAKSLCQWMIGFTTSILIAGLVAFFLIGKLKFSFIILPFLILILLLAFTIDFLISSIIGIAAFWLEDTTSFRFVYEKLVFILGGMLIPLEVFPKWLSSISAKLPFSYIVYYPAKLFVMFNFTLFWNVLLIQIVYILVFGLILALIYRLAIRKVNIHGG